MEKNWNGKWTFINDPSLKLNFWWEKLLCFLALSLIGVLLKQMRNKKKAEIKTVVDWIKKKNLVMIKPMRNNFEKTFDLFRYKFWVLQNIICV